MLMRPKKISLWPTPGGTSYNGLDNRQLTIIPRVRVGYEMVDSQRGATGIIVVLKAPTKYREFFPTFVKTTDFQLVFNFDQTRTVTIFGEHGVVAHIP